MLLQNDRKWCVVNADTHSVITARTVGSVRRVSRILSTGCLEALTKQMVLISPRIERDEKSPHGGKLVVSFPLESGCDTFEVPLNPTPELVSKWEL